VSIRRCPIASIRTTTGSPTIRPTTVPDVATLQASGKVTVGVGATSEGELAHRTAVALAAALGVKPVVFPGGHGGYNRAVAEFAAVIHTTLQG
jgi:hypothetical protein